MRLLWRMHSSQTVLGREQDFRNDRRMVSTYLVFSITAGYVRGGEGLCTVSA